MGTTHSRMGRATVLALFSILAGWPMSAQAAGQAGAQPNGKWVTEVIATDLDRPHGIVAGDFHTLYFTEVPTPGVGGSAGGTNAVKRLDLRNGKISTVSDGEPEPVQLARDRDGNLLWTCKSAGVILRRNTHGEIEPFLTGLTEPSGITADRNGEIIYTQLPTPGTPGSRGGANAIIASDGVTTTPVSMGEPEPTDVAIALDGSVYWTCTSAGVILRRSPAGVISLFRNELEQPKGIAVDPLNRYVYFTEVPTPGVSGNNGGTNRVSRIEVATGELEVINEGDPEPTDITVQFRSVYWTCTSAGVIVRARQSGPFGN